MLTTPCQILSCLSQTLAASVAMYLGQIKAGGIDCL